MAQTSTVRGKVYDKTTGEPISFADVIVANSTIGVSTDIDGFYTISGLKEGELFIYAQYLGYDTSGVSITVRPGSIIIQNFFISSSGVILNSVDVTAQRTAAKTEILISKIAISQAQIKAMPSLGGEPDVAQYLQVIPGIVSTGDQGGQLFIRGGAPVQNKILLDGLNIYNPFHSLGLFSAFETDIIKTVDVYTAGFNAEYGGRTSAVIDIKTREGNKVRPGGFVSLSPFAGRAMIEAPLKKFTEEGNSISILATMKKSLLSYTDNVLYKHAILDDSVGLPFNFTDFYTKLSIGSASGSKFNFFGFKFADQYTNPRISNIGWGNVGFGTDFTLIPAGSSLVIDGTVGFTDYKTDIREGNEQPRESSIKEIGGNIGFSYFGEKTQVKYGFDFRAISTDFSFVNPFGYRLGQNQNTSEVAGFVKVLYNLNKKILFEPSFRVMYYASQRRVSPEPRLGLKANLTDRLRLKFGGGFYTQNVISTSNDRDIVNLFNGFLTGPEEPVKDPSGNSIENKLVQSKHAVGGVEYDLFDGISINVEGYYKDFPQIIVVNRNKLSAEESNYAKEEGWAYGIDFSTKVTKRKYDIWATYSYGFVRRDDGFQIYPTVFDRRHNINFVSSYYFDAKRNTSFGLRWNLGTGLPFTQTRGFYNQQNITSSNTNYTTSNPNDFGIIYASNRNGGRLPDYHRLDVSFTHIINISKHSNLELNASAVNTYNRDNIFYFDRIRYSRVNQLPFMPSVAAKLTF